MIYYVKTRDEILVVGFELVKLRFIAGLLERESMATDRDAMNIKPSWWRLSVNLSRLAVPLL